jgi:anaerobic magnesium-protoporphyrin IX monomethyl ester cyclase
MPKLSRLTGPVLEGKPPSFKRVKIVHSETKTLLIFCPYWEPSMPYLSLPSLSAYLRQNGYPVDQWDLNLRFYEEAFSQAYLERRFQERASLLSAEHQTLLKDLIAQLGHLEQVKQVFKTEAFYDSVKLLEAERELEKVYTCFNLLYPGAKLSKDHFQMPERHAASSEEVIKATHNTLSNPFIDFFTKIILPEIEQAPPQIIGFSIAREYQIIPSFTLARLIRERLPEIHLTIGGAYFSKIADGLKSDHHPVFKYLLHSAVKGEGEEPLLKLAQAVSGKITLADVPGLIYNLPDGRLQVNESGLALSMNDDIGAPDFDGLDLKNYWSADLVLPILGSRDCYWKDCSFCDHYMQFSGFRSRKPEKIAEDLQILQNKYGARHFQFCDETMSPNFGRRLGHALEARKMDVHWYTMARLQKNFDKETSRLWRQAGCLFILMGLESANAELAQKMVKGTDNSITETVFQNLHEDDIFTFAFLFFGFPGETLETASETVRFIRKNQASINSLGSGVFILQKTTPIFRNHQAFGITPNQQDLEDDLSCVIRFDIENAMNTEQAVLFHRRFIEEMELTYRGALWGKIPRIAFFLYLSRYGKQKVIEHNGLSPIDSTLEQVRSLKQQGHLLAAEHINQSILKRYPGNSLAANQAAYFALEKNNLPQAEYWLLEAQKYGTKLAETHLVAGLLHLAHGLLNQALSSFEQALGKDPYLSEGYLLLAELYRDRHDRVRSEYHAREALKIHAVDQAFERYAFYTSQNLTERCQAILGIAAPVRQQIESPLSRA